MTDASKEVFIFHYVHSAFGVRTQQDLQCPWVTSGAARNTIITKCNLRATNESYKTFFKMSHMAEDAPVYPSPEFTLSAATRKAKFERAKDDLAQRIEHAAEQQQSLPDQASKNGFGAAVKLVMMHQHRELLRRTKAIEFQKRTLQLRCQKFEFKKPRGKKSFYVKHVIPADPADYAYYNDKHVFRIMDDKDKNVTGSTFRGTGVLTADPSASGNTLNIKWDGTKIAVDMNAIAGALPPYVSASR